MKNRHYPIVFVLLTVAILCGCQKQDPSANMQPIVDQYVEFWNTGEFDNIENILHEDFELRTSPEYEAKTGIEAFQEYVQQLRTVYPDFTVHIDEMVYCDGVGAARWTVEGTNTGEGRFPPTGKHVSIQGLSFMHFKDGKILDERIAQNNDYLYEQLGFQLIPPAPPEAEEE